MQQEETKFDNPDNEKKLKLLAEDVQDFKGFREKIYKLYKDEFDDSIAFILLTKESDFLRWFNHKMYLIIEDIYSPDAYSIKTFSQLIKEIEIQINEECYQKSFTVLTNGWNEHEQLLLARTKTLMSVDTGIKRVGSAESQGQSGSENDFMKSTYRSQNPQIQYLSDFRRHCKLNEEALHKCKGRFIPVYDEGKLTHVICAGCKCAFYSSSILMYCGECNKEFYSCYMSNYDKECQPATWDKYHCGAVVNEQMKCIQCKNPLYLRLKDTKLICKACKFESDPLSISWLCTLCKKSFRTRAKIYNPMEHKLMKNAIKNAILNKSPVRPWCLPCCGSDPSTLRFFHKAECRGLLYSGDISDKNVVVCSSCRAICQDTKFLWTCPICNKNFQNVPIKKKTNEEEEVKYIYIEPFEEEIENKSKCPQIEANDIRERKKHISLFIGAPEIDRDIVEECPFSFRYRTTSGKFPVAENKLLIKTLAVEDLKPKIQKKKSFKICNPVKNCDMDVRLTKYDSPKQPKTFMKPVHLKLLEIEKEDILGKPVARQPIPEYQEEEQVAEEAGKSKEVEIGNKLKYEELQRKILQEKKAKPFIETESLTRLQGFDFEDFSVISQIGEGEYGNTYLVEDSSKTPFIMKKIIVNSKTEMNSIIKEYETVRKFNQPHIIRVLATCERALDTTSYILYILMEAGKGDWQREIEIREERKTPYTEEELMGILRQQVSALAYLQRKRICHQDIKPQNVLVFQNFIYKLADFGDSKSLSAFDDKKDLSTFGGTELFMSPLIFSAHQSNQNKVKHNAFKSDVFSLGMSILFASTLSVSTLDECRRLHDRESLLVLLHKKLRALYSVTFIQLVAKMMEINEIDRYDFIELEEFLKEMEN